MLFQHTSPCTQTHHKNRNHVVRRYAYNCVGEGATKLPLWCWRSCNMCRVNLWVKLITKASLSTEMLQTTAVLDVSKGCKASHRIIIEVILIMMDCDLYGLI